MDESSITDLAYCSHDCHDWFIKKFLLPFYHSYTHGMAMDHKGRQLSTNCVSLSLGRPDNIKEYSGTDAVLQVAPGGSGQCLACQLYPFQKSRSFQ